MRQFMQQHSLWRNLLSVLGVDIYTPNKAAFYHELNGTLLVRAERNELVLIEAAMNTLGVAPNRAQKE